MKKQILSIILTAICLAPITLIGMESEKLSTADERLLAAAKSGNVVEAQQALTDGANVNAVEEVWHDRLTALYYAALGGHEEVVQHLLEVPGIIVNKGKGSYNPLGAAANNGHEAVFRLLLADDRVDVNGDTDTSFPPLHVAASEGRASMVTLLLADLRINVNTVDHFQDGALHAASGTSPGTDETFQLLLADPRTDPNLADKWGNTVLHHFARDPGCAPSDPESKQLAKFRALTDDPRTNLAAESHQGRHGGSNVLHGIAHAEYVEVLSQKPIFGQLMAAKNGDGLQPYEAAVWWFKCEGRNKVYQYRIDALKPYADRINDEDPGCLKTT